jgi:CheY-like chemotaxis protein
MPRPRILLVDDDRRVRQLVGLTLPADDYELSFAEDGTDAIRMAQQTRPDLILLDYAMPGFHGVDVCAAIRSDSSMSATPIIMLTGHGDEDIRQRSILAGAKRFPDQAIQPDRPGADDQGAARCEQSAATLSQRDPQRSGSSHEHGHATTDRFRRRDTGVATRIRDVVAPATSRRLRFAARHRTNARRRTAARL